jgi:hypothetical protein
VHSENSSGYQKIVFESNSVYSGGQASALLTPLRRKGLLSQFARAGMKALKKISLR